MEVIKTRMGVDSHETYYDILGVAAGADTETLKTAYRKLVRQFHPDVNPDNPDAERLFKRIGEAYNVLSDPQRRSVYDAAFGIRPAVKTRPRSPSPTPASTNGTQAKRPPPTGTANGNGASSSSAERKPSPPPPSASPHPGPAHAEGPGFKDMFDSLFGRPEEKKPPPPGANGKAKPPPRASEPTPAPSAAKPVRGEDITVEAVISTPEAKNGIVKTVNIQHAERCKRCSATGKLNGVPCPVCHGEKQLIALRKIDVRIPAGVKDGSKVRVAREGVRGHHGGEPGDLFLLVKLETDSPFRFEGANVLSDIPISVTEAVLGADIDIPTLHGAVRMHIPPGTPSGKTFRLKGQGAVLSSVTGDQLVTVIIVPPRSLSPKEEALYRELQQLSREHPREKPHPA